MMNNITKTVHLIFIFLFLQTIINHLAEASRDLRNNVYPESFVSDGMNSTTNGLINEPYLLLKGMHTSGGHEESCEHMYGFLPCANNISGHFFLILVYQYLLFLGESYLDAGGDEIFTFVGPGVYGASLFNIIGVLPESLLILASELMKRKESAEEYVYTGVGLLAGSTIFDLTLLWGFCVIFGRQVLPVNNSATPPCQSDYLNLRNRFSWFNAFGAITDEETSWTARIMVFSVIPFLIIQLLQFITTSFARQTVLFVSLIVSVVFILVYFGYQLTGTRWLQKKRLSYVKHERVMLGILGRVKHFALDGKPNPDLIHQLFHKMDGDGDALLSKKELKELFEEEGEDIDGEIADMMDEFDLDGDGNMGVDEFVHGVAKWVHHTKEVLHNTKSLEHIHKVFVPWLDHVREEIEQKKKMISAIYVHVQGDNISTLLTEEGKPDQSSIESLFERFDVDKDGHISEKELKDILEGIKFSKDVPLQIDEVVAKIFKDFDINRDSTIDFQEFLSGMTKLIKMFTESEAHSAPHQPQSHQMENVEGMEKQVHVEKDQDEPVEKPSAWAWFKAIMKLLFGLVILGLLAEPLIHSVQSFSSAISIPSFFVAFIFVPLATGLRSAITVIVNVRSKKKKTSSSSFSEIYGGVFMNNLLGFSVILTLIYARGLTWEYSAEVLVVLIVCGVMGSVASFRSTFPVWISVMAFLLYPLSLLLIYLLHHFGYD